jgi:hypothetical protein
MGAHSADRATRTDTGLRILTPETDSEITDEIPAIPATPHRWIRPGGRAHRCGEELRAAGQIFLNTCGVASVPLTALIYTGVETIYGVPLSAFLWTVWRGVAIATVLLLTGWGLALTAGRERA